MGIYLEKFKASPELEAWLKKQAGPHYVCDDTHCQIDSLEGLQSFRALHGSYFRNAPIPVYPWRYDSPFTPTGDAAYQAYHDRCHAVGGYQFDMGGEYRLACYHYNHARSTGLGEQDALTLYHHVASRVEFHYHHNGDEPPCRATFLAACFAYGGRKAAKGDYLIPYFDYTG